MDMERVHEVLHRWPFKPFVICLADGRRLSVTGPNSVAVGKRQAFVIGPDDSCSRIDPQMIVAVDLVGEGGPKKREQRGEPNRITIEQIRELYNAAPFKSFVIHLADGRQIPVSHREYIALSPSGRTIIVYQTDDTSTIIDLLLVIDLKLRNREVGKRHHS